MKYFRDEDESQDAVMQVFEKLLKDLLQFEVSNFKPWLHQVVRNHCLMQLRKAQTSNKRQEEYKNFALSDMESEEASHLLDEDDDAQRLTRLQQAIGQLNEEQKRCVELFFLENKSYQQIADETGYSANQVKSYLQNGKRNIKNLMGTIAYLLLFWQ
jgi:RNA polymerase sigma-70 factor (ECF subfamily)